MQNTNTTKSWEPSLSVPTTAKLPISDLKDLMENKYMFRVWFISMLLNPVCASPRYMSQRELISRHDGSCHQKSLFPPEILQLLAGLGAYDTPSSRSCDQNEIHVGNYIWSYPVKIQALRGKCVNTLCLYFLKIGEIQFYSTISQRLSATMYQQNFFFFFPTFYFKDKLLGALSRILRI